MRVSLISTIIAIGASTASAFTVTPARTSHALFMSSGVEEKRTGIVKWFNTEKGFGFIVPDDGESDVFVHQTSIIADGFRSLADGEPVEFFVVEDPKTGKMKASEVTGPGGAHVQGAPYQAGY